MKSRIAFAHPWDSARRHQSRIRSAQIGHHFAGPSNRFWRCSNDSGLVHERLARATITGCPSGTSASRNLIARATPGIDTLRPEEYAAGERILRRKVRRWKPRVVAFVGVTLYRAVFKRQSAIAVVLGLQEETFEGRGGVTCFPIRAAGMRISHTERC
jgi:TDG/mug DNA glycosylase family protein